jgi:hypothetical protein
MNPTERQIMDAFGTGSAVHDCYSEGEIAASIAHDSSGDDRDWCETQLAKVAESYELTIGLARQHDAEHGLRGRHLAVVASECEESLGAMRERVRDLFLAACTCDEDPDAHCAIHGMTRPGMNLRR